MKIAISVLAIGLMSFVAVYGLDGASPEEKSIPWFAIIICAYLVGLIIIDALEAIIRKRNSKRYSNRPKEKSKEEGKKSILNSPNIIWDILSFAAPLLVAYIILSYIIMVSVVQSGSMEPKLPVGDTVFYNRLAYVNAEPQRGDVVVFYSQEYREYFGKRIIGIPGDVIQFRDGYVIINGRYYDETTYISSETETNCLKEFEVPEGCYFMLGDNREDSNDSRYWNDPYIPKECLSGKYMRKINFSFQFDIFYKLFSTL